MKWLLPALIAAAAVYLIDQANAAQREPGEPPSEDDDQETTIMDDLKIKAGELVGGTAPAVGLDVAMANRRAFLDMLAYAEGTSGPEGYRTMFGGGLFNDFSDHPRVYFPFTNGRGETLKTSAAGRYQFLARTWDSLRDKLQLPDFGPDSQDAAALELVRQRGALADVDAGRLADAVTKCAPIWASLPGAGYAQPERKFAQLQGAFYGAGGVEVA